MKIASILAITMCLALVACNDSDSNSQSPTPPENIVGLWVDSAEFTLLTKPDLDCASLSLFLMEDENQIRIFSIEAMDVSADGKLSISSDMYKNSSGALLHIGSVNGNGTVSFLLPEITQDIEEDAKASIAITHPELQGLPLRVEITLKYGEASQTLDVQSMSHVTDRDGQQVQMLSYGDATGEDLPSYKKMTAEDFKRIIELARSCL